MVDESFEDFMAMLDGPVFVATTQCDGQPSGCLVTFATQTSVRPPSFLVVVPRDDDTHEAVTRSGHVAVHALAQSQVGLAELFDGQADKFDRCSWRAGPQGMPILDEAIAWFVGRTAHWIEIGDHIAHVLEPVATWAPEIDDELLYLSDLDEADPGHEAPHRLFERAPKDTSRRYGLRFTLDGF